MPAGSFKNADCGVRARPTMIREVRAVSEILPGVRSLTSLSAASLATLPMSRAPRTPSTNKVGGRVVSRHVRRCTERYAPAFSIVITRIWPRPKSETCRASSIAAFPTYLASIKISTYVMRTNCTLPDVRCDTDDNANTLEISIHAPPRIRLARSH